jgi:hypothetical protein
LTYLFLFAPLNAPTHQPDFSHKEAQTAQQNPRHGDSNRMRMPPAMVFIRRMGSQGK